ncbi:hypothetical protein ACU4GD_36565 [Cupriavidus basilensis]
MRNIIVGFVLVHMGVCRAVVHPALAGQGAWHVDAATVATRIGLLQLAFGTLGSIAGGVLFFSCRRGGSWWRGGCLARTHR